MARISVPLLSSKAWGTLAKQLTFRRRKHLVDAIKTPLPTDAMTAIQRAQRLLFRDAVAWWHALTDAEKQAYDKPGREHHMSGYAWFIRSYLLNPPAATFLSLTDTPGVYTGEAGHAPIINAAETDLIWGTVKEYPSGIVDLPGQSRAKAWLDLSQPDGFVFLSAVDYDVQNEFDVSSVDGTADATVAWKLHDTGKFTEAAAYYVGRWLFNTTDKTMTPVTAKDSDDQLSIAANIMANGEGYKLRFSRFTATEAGVYLCIGQVTVFQMGANSGMLTTSICKNGVPYVAPSIYIPPIMGFWAGIGMDFVNLAVGDYLDLRSYLSFDGAINLAGNVDRTFLTVGKIA